MKKVSADKKRTVMRHPWWIVNSSLLIISIFAILFIIFSRPSLPRKISFEPEEVRPVTREISKIDLNKIYANDLFDTFKSPIVEPTKEEDAIKPVPPPPVAKPVQIPITPPPRFLEPLAITLKGIIIGSDETLNVAMIENSRDKTSKNYRINDKLEDAQLIKIFKNKIILVRSNGQQETLYVSPHDAELEQLLSPRNNWSAIIQKRADDLYAIDPDLFIERVQNLAQFIDLFNLTTVYRQGKSIGCRVGKMQQGTPGLSMGLMSGDIIEEINTIPATDTNNRFNIYKDVMSKNIGDTITVQIMRKGTPITLKYVLEKLEQPSTQETISKSTAQQSPEFPQEAPLAPATPLSPEETAAQTAALMDKNRRYAQAVNDVKKYDKQLISKTNHKYNSLRMNKNILSTKAQAELYG